MFVMADLGVKNLFGVSYDRIIGMKKKDLVNHAENLKGKVTYDVTIKLYAKKYQDRAV